MDYLRFVRQHRRFLAFGMLVALFTSFGQTYFIGLFSAEIRVAFDLSHGDFGLVYSLASLAAGVCLIWLGGFVDRVDLRPWVAILGVAAVGACIVMGIAPSVVVMGIALFLLRLSCQSLLAHTYMCIAPGSLDTSLSHAAGLSDIAVCHA